LPRGSAGFSLIELLIVVVVMVVLTALYWKSKEPSREQRTFTACAQNLENIYIAMDIYAHDNGGRYPAMANAKSSEEALALLVPKYTSDTAVFICPGTKNATVPAVESFSNAVISYAYVMGRRSGEADAQQQILMSDRQVNTAAKNPGDLIFSTTGKPPANNHGKGGGNFLFCDGRVEMSTAMTVAPAIVLTSAVVLLNPKP
jgi:prepilin-type N-terminal cleavage/methylation domain-containing protein/prepilin-type processing-associated H-X9-DG protein